MTAVLKGCVSSQTEKTATEIRVMHLPAKECWQQQNQKKHGLFLKLHKEPTLLTP
jgi:hypothetical protein